MSMYSLLRVIVFLHRLHLCFCFYSSQRRLLPTAELRNVADNNGEGEHAEFHRDTTYSWTNPKLRGSDFEQQKKNSNGPSFKRIQFQFCGSILIHSGNSGTGRTSLQHTGVMLWSAAYAMSYYIDAMWSQESARNGAAKWTVVDLGAGLGLCSAVAAKHGMNVISTDSDLQALPLLEENLKRNCNNDSSISVHTLDWIAATEEADIKTHPVFIELEKYGGPDLIILSDVIYSATKPAWEALIKLLSELRSLRMRLQCKATASIERKRCDSTNTPESDPLVLLGYTQRRRDMTPQDENEFFNLLRKAGMEAVLVPSSHIPHGETYLLTSLFELRWVN